MSESTFAGEAVPSALLAVVPPWNRTDLPVDPALKATQYAVEGALDALEISLELSVEGWRLPSPQTRGPELPEPLRGPMSWVRLLTAGMPTLSDVTWPRIRENASPRNPRWRAICEHDLTELQIAALAMLWIEDYIGTLMASTSGWLEQALSRAARPDQITRAGELLTTYFTAAPGSRLHLVPMVGEGIGEHAVDFFSRLERDPRLEPRDRLWMEHERRRLQGELPSALPDWLWMMRGKRLVQVRQLYCISIYEPLGPVELTFDDDTAVQVDVRANGLRFYAERDDRDREAMHDHGVHSNPGEFYMVDRSEEPQIWPAIADELTRVEPHLEGPYKELTGVTFHFGDVLMSVREIGARDAESPWEHTISVSWSSAESSDSNAAG